MLNVKQVAEVIKAGTSSVRKWAARGLFPGARHEETPLGSYWLIPETALDGFVKPTQGRKPAKKGEAK